MTSEAIRTLKERCLKYKSRTELMYGDAALYRRIHRAGKAAVEYCFAHMPPKHRRIWTIEEMVRESRKYATRTEMLEAAPGLYMAIIRRGLLFLLPPSRKGKK